MMGTGCTTSVKLAQIETMIADVPGDVAEIGTAGGATTHRLAGMASRRGCLVHAFDSFVGMPEPGKFDSAHYPRGKYDAGGVDGFRRIMDGFKADPAYYRLWPGWVPDCFLGAEQLRFAFAFVDVDVYEATGLSLQWVWPRLVANGILLADDYFPGGKIMASKAIDEWLSGIACGMNIMENTNNQLMIRKEAEQ
jgi:O-methyltransferase